MESGISVSGGLLCLTAERRGRSHSVPVNSGGGKGGLPRAGAPQGVVFAAARCPFFRQSMGGGNWGPKRSGNSRASFHLPGTPNEN